MKPIPKFTSYSVTMDGRVYSYKLRPGFVNPIIDKIGYIRYMLIDDEGKRRGIYAHQAVAQTYIPNPQNKPEVNHLDHDKANNAMANLRWCTHQENVKYDWAKGKRPRLSGKTNPNNKHASSLVKKLRKLFATGQYSQMGLSRMFSIPQPTVHVIVRQKQWENI